MAIGGDRPHHEAHAAQGDAEQEVGDGGTAVHRGQHSRSVGGRVLPAAGGLGVAFGPLAVGSLFTLLDDIASILDDVATLTKVATKKTAGVLGDDLALNAEQVTGVRPARELPVIWAVFKGSALNKVILVPAALLLSALLPVLIVPVLMLGGAFLCFEGFEKLVHKFLHASEEKAHHEAHVKAIQDPDADLVEFERQRIRGAIRTDLILSGEIVVIALGTVADEPLLTRALVLAAISAGMTIGVYGLVAGIVKLDDLGVILTRKGGGAAKLGAMILTAAPWLMKLLSVAGTIAMFLVGGGILAHGIPPIHHWVQHNAPGFVLETAINGGTGLLAGAILVGLHTLVSKLRGKKAE